MPRDNYNINLSRAELALVLDAVNWRVVQFGRMSPARHRLQAVREMLADEYERGGAPKGTKDT